MQGQPYICWGFEEQLALFRCLSSELALPIAEVDTPKVRDWRFFVAYLSPVCLDIRTSICLARCTCCDRNNFD